MRVEVEPGVAVHVHQIGSGPPVVLIPGFGMDHRVWDAQVRRLAANHRVVCVDQRGHGQSDAPLAGYDVATLARDVLTVLDAADVPRCSIVGWSFGGQVAFLVAALAPERVRQLVLVSSNGVRASRGPGFPFGQPPERLLPAMIAAEQQDRIAARRATIRAGFCSEPDRELLDHLLGISLAMPSWAAIPAYRSMLETDLLERLPRVRCPVLQVIGSQDPVLSARGAVWLCERLAQARLVTLEGCGHYPMFEAQAGFDAALLDFLS